MSRIPWRTLTSICAAGVGVLTFGELQAWRASRADYPRHPSTGPADGRDVVLVLGFRSRPDGRLNALQAWRTRIAVRSAPPGALFVFSGAAVHGGESEAAVMSRYGVQHLGIPPADVTLEGRAMTTRENLSLSLPWLRDAATIRIVSNTAHARRARQYLHSMDAELFARLRRTRDYVPLELGPLRLALTFYDFLAGRIAGHSAGHCAERAAARPEPTPPA
ncbi:MAG: YdcF family protein [Microbacterium sp.]